MDFIKQAADSFNGKQNQGEQASNQQQQQHQSQPQGEQKQEGGSFFSGIGNKLNAAAGGGKESEKNEDYLDKAVDWAQERMGQGPQDNESALEQAKDEQISDFIRDKYKTTTGSDFPIKDKETGPKFGN